MNYIKLFVYTLLYIFGATLLVTILNFYSILNNNIIAIIKLLIPLISIFVGGLKLGILKEKKGYLEGLKLGVMVITFLFFYNIIFIKDISVKSLLYYLILIISSIFGSMIGINKKKDN